MRDIMRRLAALERIDDERWITFGTGRDRYRMAPGDMIGLVMRLMQGSLDLEEGKATENPAHSDPAWLALSRCEDIGPGHGSLLTMLHREAKAWAEAQADGKDGSG